MNTLVKRQNHIASVFRRIVARRIEAVYDIAFIVAQHNFSAVRTAQNIFAGKFQTFLAFTVDIGKTDNMCKQVAHWVMAFQLFLETESLDAQRSNLIGFFLAQLAFQIDKVFFLP